jgi:phage shock protein PspC (stress-responsive transcriptional regulator)/predicted membrane protein
VVAGVAGGLGQYFDVDPVIFRIAFVVLAFVGGAGFLLYPAAWLLLPEEGHGRSIGEAWVQRGRRGRWLPIALIVIGGLILSGEISNRRHDGGIGFAVIAIVIGVLLLRRHPAPPPPAPPAPWSAGLTPEAGSPAGTETPSTSASSWTPPPPPPPKTPPPDITGGGGSWGPPADALRPKGRPLTAIVLSILLISGGVVGLLHSADVVSVSVPVFLAAALIFTGVALLVSAWTGGTGGLIAVAVVLTVALAVATVVRTPFTGGWGDQRWVPSSLAEVRSTYRHGGGHVVIDLSHVTFPAEGRSVRARLGVGDLTVVVPAGARVAVDAHAGLGDVRLLGHHRDGIDVDDSVVADDAADGSLRLHLDVGAGQVEVVRAGSVPRVIPPVGVPSPPLPPSPPSTVGLG